MQDLIRSAVIGGHVSYSASNHGSKAVQSSDALLVWYCDRLIREFHNLTSILYGFNLQGAASRFSGERVTGAAKVMAPAEKRGAVPCLTA
jgi:hypothetical protein